MHMRFHLLKYIEENYDLMTSILKGPLEVRCMTLDLYMRKMYNCETCRYEITLLILTHMYQVPILVIRSDMLWLSSNVAAIDCPIVLVQNSCGQFLGTKTKCPVFVGNVPKITFPKKPRNRKPVAIKHSTPLRNEDAEEKVFGSGQEILSPIAEKSGNSSIEHDHTYSSDDKGTCRKKREVC